MGFTEGGCGGMCWPMDLQHEEFLFEFFGGFNPLRGATTGEGVKEFPWNFASTAPPMQSLRDSAAATPVGCAAWRRRFRNDDGLGVVVVWTEGDCGSMCWPVDRPATHAAAGAAARGTLIFLFWGILSHAREWMAPRPAAGQARGVGFCFFFEGCSGVGAGALLRLF